MNTFRFLAFAAATFVTLSTTSCSKQEDAVPAQPVATSGSADALVSNSVALSNETIRGQQFKNIAWSTNATHNIIVKAFYTGGATRVNNYPNARAGRYATSFLRSLSSRENLYNIQILLDGSVKYDSGNIAQ